MTKINVTEMNSQISNAQAGPWISYVCKDSALIGRAKKLAPKVNAICKVLELDPDSVNVSFDNIKPVSKSMFDRINMDIDTTNIQIDFHNASKNSRGFVFLTINDNGEAVVEQEYPTWKDLKAALPEMVEVTEDSECVEPEEEEVEEVEEEEEEVEVCDEDCDQCECICEEEEDEVEELGTEKRDECPFEDELDNPYDDED